MRILALLVPGAALTNGVSVVSLELPPCDYSVAHKCWRWKSLVLGDDMGLPRRRAARSLREVVRGRPGVDDCLVLATCARLDLLMTGPAAFDAAADVLARQVGGKWPSFAVAALDAVDMWPNDAVEPTLDVRDALALHSDSAAALRVALVATAAHDFDPTCSRRAHVLRQIRACVAPDASPELRVVVNAALEAGKRARDPREPHVETFRDDPKKAVAVVREIASGAADRAMARLRARAAGPAIAALRRESHDRLATLLPRHASERERRLAAKALNRELHGATLDLRESATAEVDVDALAARALAAVRQC